MSINRVISISEDLNARLKQEENASGLIASLLIDYYKTNVKNICEIEERQKSIEEQRKNFMEKYSEDYATLEKRKQIIKQDIETLENIRQKQFIRQQEFKKNIMDHFKEELSREMTEEEYIEYLDRFENEKGFNFFKFIEEKKGVES